MNIEKLILSHLMNNPKRIPDAIFFIGDKEGFFKEYQNQVLYEILCHMHEANRNITINGLALEIKADKRLDGNAMVLVVDLWQSESVFPSEFDALMLNGVEQYLYRQLHKLNLTIESQMLNGVHPLVVLTQMDKELKSINESISFNQQIDIEKLITKSITDIISRYDALDEIGINSGFEDLEELHGRFMPGTLSVLAARPSMGKTAFALSLAINIAQAKHSVMFFSIEMSAMELCGRMISQVGMVQNSLVLKNVKRLQSDEFTRIFKASDVIKKMDIKLIDDGHMNIQKIKMHIARHKPKFVIIDYLQIISPTNPKEGQDTNKFYEDLTRDLKITAKENNTTILLLSQLNRGVETRTDKRPILADLRSSGGIEQNADSVMFIHRPYYYDKESEIDLAEIIVAKNRNGRVGKCDLKFMDVFTKFDNALPKIKSIGTGNMDVRQPYKDNDEQAPF